MQCDICFRTGVKDYLCPTDARNLLYEPRIQNARVLLEKDALEQQASALLPQLNARLDKTSSGIPLPTDSPNVAAIVSERDQTIDRTEQIIAHADELRVKVEHAKEVLAKKKAIIDRRRSEMASASNGTGPRRARQVDDTEKAIRMAKYKWNQNHGTMASSRTYLCGEAAKLYGLRRVRRNGSLEEYKIGGIGIVDLRAMNTASPAQISTALSHVVHLLMLSTHYLAIRLPAEITLPHRDYPLPTIFPLAASYKHVNVSFPGTTPVPSSNPSPTASRHSEQAVQPRPRPLFIKKPLPILATEDQPAYALFIEAVTLLAYDVAWLCKSQGISVGDENNFEDICNVGKNLYNLLIGARPRPGPASRGTSNQSTPIKGGREGEAENDERRAAPAVAAATPIMGRYSHGSAHSFLGAAEGTEYIRSWKLTSPPKLADKLKSRLMSEVANAEWEMLEENAWAVDDELGSPMGGDAVVVGARKEVERGYGLGMQSFMSMRTVLDAVERVGGTDADRKSGSNGWTKLKPR